MESGISNDWKPIMDDGVEEHQEIREEQRVALNRFTSKVHLARVGSKRHYRQFKEYYDNYYKEYNKEYYKTHKKKTYKKKYKKEKYNPVKEKRKRMKKSAKDGRPKILCLYGPSGCGKTTATQFLEEKYGANVICSYTTRPMRENERNMVEHYFVGEVPPREEMLAYTKFGDYEYWALKSQVFGPLTVYVVDEAGINQMAKLTDEFRIYPVHIKRTEKKRLDTGVSPERIARDACREDIKTRVYFTVNNMSTKSAFVRAIDRIYKKVLDY